MFSSESEVPVRPFVVAACLTGALALALLLPSAADATIIEGGCLADRSPIGTNCVSNDLTFVLVGLGVQADGCVQSGLGLCSISGGSCTSSAQCPPGETCEYLDEVDIFLRAVIRNTTAQARYDVGLWFSIDGDENMDGALTGTCGREMIHPLGACSGSGFPCNFDIDCGGGETCDQVLAQSCPPLDLLGNDPLPVPTPPQGPADGPFLTAESSPSVPDRCGDLFAGGAAGCDENMDGTWDDTVLDFDQAVTIPCSDIDEDGFVNIGTCASWGNQGDQVHLGVCVGGANAGDTCDANNDCPGGTCAEQGVCNELSGNALAIGMPCTGDADCGGGAGSCEFAGADTCDSEWELFNGTASHCRCEQVNSNIPSSSLSLTCTLVNQCTVSLEACDSDADCTMGVEDVCVTPSLTMPELSSRIFDLTFANAAPLGCTPDPTPADLDDERFQCGTASFIQWDLVDDQIDGNPENGSFENIVSESTGGTVLPMTPADGVTWTPLNDLEPLNMTSEPGELGVIYPGHEGTLRFKYRLGDFTTFPDSVTISATTYWANSQSFMPRVAQTLTASCPLLTVDTWAAVSDVRAFVLDGRSVVEWTTTTEVATKQFELYRLEGRSWAPVGDGPIASRMAGDGGIYRVVDDRAYPGETATYRLVEVTFDGYRRSVGPFTVTVAAGTVGAPPVERGADGFGRDGKGERAADLIRGAAVAPAGKADAPGAPAATIGALEHRPAPRQLARVRQAAREAAGGRQLAARVPTAVLKADVRADGVHRVSALDLANQWGVPAGNVQQMILAGDIRLTNRGEELAWAGAADGSALYFFGQGATEVDTAANVYRIEPFPGTPAATVSGGNPAPVAGGTFQERLVLEDDNVAVTNAVRQSGVDFWFWQGVQDPSSASSIATFDVGVPGATGSAGELSVRLYSVSDTAAPQEHTAIVRLNGVELGQTSWEDIRFHEAAFPFPGGLLQAGLNQVEVEAFRAGGEVTAFFVDELTFAYERELRAEAGRLVFAADAPGAVTVSGFAGADLQVLEITDPLAIRRVTDVTIDELAGDFRASFEAEAGARYAVSRTSTLEVAGALRTDVPSSIRQAAGAQYVVVAPAHLVGQAGGLASLRRYLTTMVVDVEDVYDEFNHGLASPRALQEFMTWASANWSVPPEYLVLVGAGHFDYKGHDVNSPPNLIPPALVATPQGIYASDHVLGDVDGDAVPEVAVGRIPVLTLAELQGYIQKLRRLERSSGPDWRGATLFVADNQDDGGDFGLSSDRVAAHLGPQYTVAKIHLDALPPADAKQQLLDALGAGVGYFNYIGHGGVTQLAQEALLTVDDAAALTNADRPGVMASLTCIAGRFELPHFDSVAEAMVLNPNGGAIAAWAPSGLSYNVDAERLNRAFVDAAFGQEITLGQAVRQALASYADEGFYRHLLLVYNVFGDPALSMR